MTDKLRVGIVGANAGQSWAKYSHVPALQALPEFEITAVATRHEESARAAAQAFGAKSWYSNSADLINSKEVDIVTVCVNVPAHYDVVMAALAANKHVYCEWPLGRNLEEAEALAAAARKTKSHVVTGVQGRANPAAIQAKQMIEEGTIGTPIAARMISPSTGFGPKFPSAYKYFDDPTSGANASTIIGGHSLDLADFLLGSVKEVQSLPNIQFKQVRVVDTEESLERVVADQRFLLLRYENGAAASIEISGGQSADALFYFEIVGTDRRIELTGGSMFGFQGGDLTLSLNGKIVGGEGLSPARGAALNVAALYRQLGQDIREDQRTVPDFEHAVILTRLLANVEKAGLEGVRISC